MTISDETLSAFLDGELSRREMAAVAEAISAEPQLADRLAAFARVDEQVKAQAEALDSVPLPDSVTRLLESDHGGHMAWWQRAGRQFREHAALAAAITLLIGFSAGQFFPADSSTSNAGNWQQVAAHLDRTASGEDVTIGGETRLLSRFTFRDQQGRYCRQFLLESPEQASENVACRDAEDWERVATVQASRIYQADDYRPASGANLLDSTLDELMQGEALSLEEEAEVMDNRW